MLVRTLKGGGHYQIVLNYYRVIQVSFASSLSPEVQHGVAISCSGYYEPETKASHGLRFLPGGSRGKSASKFIGVAGRIQFLVVLSRFVLKFIIANRA